MVWENFLEDWELLMSGKNFFSKNIQWKQKFKRLYLSAMHCRDVQFLIDWSNYEQDLMLSMSRSNDLIVVIEMKIVLTELIFKALAKCSTPSSPILFSRQSKVINVYFHRRINEKTELSNSVFITELYRRAFARCFAPHGFISLDRR